MTDAIARVTHWQLAILRFAVTLDTRDRAAVLAIAKEMDRLGSRAARAKFAFFVRTSSGICDGIVDNKNPEKTEVLRRHVSKIDDARLRRALEAILQNKTVETQPNKPQSREDLFRGLLIR